MKDVKIGSQLERIRKGIKKAMRNKFEIYFSFREENIPGKNFNVKKSEYIQT